MLPERGYETVKRGHKHHLLRGTRVVETGTGIFGRDTAHGRTVDRQHQAVFQITHTTDPDIIPAFCNPFGELLGEGQFTTRDDANRISLELPDITRQGPEDGHRQLLKV